MTESGRPCVRDQTGRIWHVLAEWNGYLWLEPKAPDDEGPWTERADEFERIDG
jgi:hypothetical protein